MKGRLEMLFSSRTVRISAALASVLLVASPVPGQMTSIDPNDDLSQADTQSLPEAPVAPARPQADGVLNEQASESLPAAEQVPANQVGTEGTYGKDDLISAATDVFGKGTQGIGKLIESILKDQGRPNAYISGREASGAFVLGVRYGSGTMSHAVEGKRQVYWTGPSIGFDAGGDAGKVLVLVYNLYDSQDLFRRFPAVEGRAYYFGGLSASYLRRGRIAMIPIRLGVGMRLGANVGYMRFSEKSRWLPL
jgi:hypothetical protein